MNLSYIISLWLTTYKICRVHSSKTPVFYDFVPQNAKKLGFFMPFSRKVMISLRFSQHAVMFLPNMQPCSYVFMQLYSYAVWFSQHTVMQLCFCNLPLLHKHVSYILHKEEIMQKQNTFLNDYLVFTEKWTIKWCKELWN